MSTWLLEAAGVPQADDDDRRRLDEDGFLVLPGHLSAPQVAAVRARIATALEESGERQGGTLHLGGLHDLGPDLDPVWLNPRLLACAAHIVGPDVQVLGVSYRAPTPGHGAQALHMDAAAGAEPGHYLVANAIVALVDFTEANGATRVVPGSHLTPWRRYPKEVAATVPDQRLITGPAGQALLFNSHLWHSGTHNGGTATREALIVSFRRRGSGPLDGPAPVSSATLERLGDRALLLL